MKTQIVDSATQRFINYEIKYWHEVILHIISVIKLLGESSLAFRGKSDKLYEHNKENFLKLIKLLVEFDPIMEEHVRRILDNEENRVSYSSRIKLLDYYMIT